LRAAGLLELFDAGYVEPVIAPRRPYHLLSQQVLAQILQHKGVTKSTWLKGQETFISQSGLDAAAGNEVLELLEARRLLAQDAGVYWFTKEGEQELGGLNFLDLMSIFTSEDLFEVRHGNREVGRVDRVTFMLKDRHKALLLGGRPWRVIDIDWNRGLVSVEPTTDPGRSRWLGDGPPMSFALAQAIRRVVCANQDSERLSRRAYNALSDARADLWWFDANSTTLHETPTLKKQWWTHAGTIVITRLAWRLHEILQQEVRSDEMSITFVDGPSTASIADALQELRSSPIPMAPEAFRPLAEKLKFHETLPAARIDELVSARFEVKAEIDRVLAAPVRYVKSS
jgi:ATP-dependent Lhr-like helicase